jgi:sugar fermentation stimulation protein A
MSRRFLLRSRVRFDPPLTTARFVRRYKRFFLDARLPSGETVVAHCPNTGSLQGCLVEGAEVLLARASDPTRKLQWTWKMIRVGGTWVGVDTGIAPALVAEAIHAGVLAELSGYERLTSEVRYGVDDGSRIDLLLSRGGEPPVGLKPAKAARALWTNDERVYIEVKNTTLRIDSRRAGCAAFPDAVTERGLKHLHELMHVVAQGQRAAMVFTVQRSDCDHFAPADAIDPAYGKALREAVKRGVEAYVLAADLDADAIALTRRLPLNLD